MLTSQTIHHYFLKHQVALESFGVRLAAVLTGLMGGVNLFSAIIPALRDRLLLMENTIPLEVRHGSRLASALAGFALLLLAGHLWRRKRMAWLLTIIILVISMLTHLLKGLDFEEASLALGLILLLVLLRASFHAIPDRPSVRQGLLALLLAFIFTMVYGISGLYLLDHHYRFVFSLWEAIRQIFLLAVTFSNPGIIIVSKYGRYFLDSIYLVGAATSAYALFMLIRPVLVRYPASAEEHERARQLVEQYGHTALARPALLDDKSYYFSPGGSVIAYASRGGGAVSLTDPFGPALDATEAIAGFCEHCRHHGWVPAFASVGPEYLSAYHQAGLETLCISNEAIVDLAQFTLEGSQNKKLRNAVTKISKLGYRAEVIHPPLIRHLMDELRSVSDEWLSMKTGGELRFAMGWFDEAYLQSGPVIIITAPDGVVVAFANLVGEFQADEITIDLMRHHRHLENGTMEFLFASLLQWAKDQGYVSFSLGQSALSNVGLKPDDPRTEKFLHYLFENFNQFYNFKGLHSFKEKFNPRWEPRYIAFPGFASLPTLVTAFIRINSGDQPLWQYFHK